MDNQAKEALMRVIRRNVVEHIDDMTGQDPIISLETDSLVFKYKENDDDPTRENYWVTIVIPVVIINEPIMDGAVIYSGDLHSPDMSATMAREPLPHAHDVGPIGHRVPSVPAGRR